MIKQRAVFLDRDGTLNVDWGYVSCTADVQLLPGVAGALQRLRQVGYLLVVVTNQSGVARGFFSLEQAQRINEHLRGLLRAQGVELDGFYLCPHHPEGQTGGAFSCVCECRKGKPGLLLQAARELDIDLSSSCMVGDKLSDVEAGYRAGCRAFLLTSEEQRPRQSDIPAYCAGVFADLPECVDFLFS